MKKQIPVAQQKPGRAPAQALVEFALAAMLISVLLAATVDLGMIFFTVQGLHNAAQEGAMYGRRLDYVDEDDDDSDNNGVTDEQDVYDSVAQAPYDVFAEMVRQRASYEAGEGGGIGFISLRDLNDDGVKDNDSVRDEYIDVEIVKTLTGHDPCDPKEAPTGCFIRVTVRAKYKILFPLAPAFADQITVSSQYTVPLMDTGYNAAGEAINDPIIETYTPTPVITGTQTTTPSPTPTITTTICDGIISPNVASAGWTEQFVENAVGKGQVGGTIDLCTVSRQIRDSGPDQFYYVEKDDLALTDEGKTPDAIEFVAKLSQWTPADTYTGSKDDAKAGIMIRGSDGGDVDRSAPYAMVNYRLMRWNGIDQYVVVYEYRSTQAGTWARSEPVVVDDPASISSNPIWFKLVKEGRFVSAAYARCGSPSCTPSDTDWVRFDDSANPYKDIAGLDAANRILFGMAVTSGHDADPTNTAGEAYATFSDIAFTNLGGLDARFVNPVHPNEQGGVVTSLHGASETPFEIEITSQEAGVEIQNTTYTIVDPDGDVVTFARGTLTDSSTTPACVFGGSAGSCDPMTEDEYKDDLLKRGEYTVVAEIQYTEGGQTKERVVSSRFQIEEISLEFVVPSVEDGGSILLTDPNQTNFELSAIDPKFGTTTGDGFATIDYTIQKPDGQMVTITKAGNATDLLCIFGGTPGSCNEMSGPITYQSLQNGIYTVRARVTSLDSTTATVMFTFEVMPVEITFIAPDPANVSNRIEMVDGILVEDPQHSTFEIQAYAPHVGTTNGDGIAEVKIVEIRQVKDGDGNAADKVIYSNKVFNAVPFCVFGGSGGTCNELVTDDGKGYYDLDSGDYVISVQVRLQGSSSWTPSTPATRLFSVPKLPIFVDFVKQNGSTFESTPADLGYYLERDQQYFDFRVAACKDEDENGCTTVQDGDGIAKVEIELTNSDGDIVATISDDDGSPFCAYPSGGSCTFMDEETYKKLVAGTYTIRARAREALAGGDGRWSEWVQRTFTIAPLEIAFIDPKPTPVDDGDDEYDDDDRKILSDLDLTRFKITAYDPRFCDAVTKDNYDPDNPDFDNCHGAGITNIDFKLFGPDDDDDEVEDLLDQVTADDTYTAGDPMCMFGEDTGDSSNCATMNDDNFEGSGDDVLTRGEYVVKARVSNAAGWTDWIDRLAIIPPVYMEFVTKRISNKNQDAPYPFEVLAYDEKASDGSPLSGDGITQVRFELYGPDSATVPIYEYTDVTNSAITVSPYPYCMFGHASNAKNCSAMPNAFYQELTSGTYTVIAYATTDDGYETSGQSAQFKIDPFAVYIEVKDTVDGSGYFDLDGGNIPVTMPQTNFEIYASNTDGGTNGTDIKQVRMTITTPSGVSYTVTDGNVAYCPFGVKSGACKTMDQSADMQAILDDPATGKYTMEIRARLTSQGSAWRWSDPVTFNFTVYEAGQRVTDDLLALYTFQNNDGTSVAGSAGPAINTVVDNGGSPQFTGGYLNATGHGVVKTSSAASSLIGAVDDEFTVEAWVKPANTTQTGPARIVSLSQDGLSGGNFILAQEGSTYEVRVHTTATDKFGKDVPDFRGGTASTASVAHIVFTRSADGTSTLYVNGNLVEQRTTSSLFSASLSWKNLEMALAGEPNIATDYREWAGEIHLVSFYKRALSQPEVLQNMAAGADYTE